LDSIQALQHVSQYVWPQASEERRRLVEEDASSRQMAQTVRSGASTEACAAPAPSEGGGTPAASETFSGFSMYLESKSSLLQRADRRSSEAEPSDTPAREDESVCHAHALGERQKPDASGARSLQRGAWSAEPS